MIAAGGQTVDEPYIYALLEAGATQQQATFGPVRVPEGHLWVVGDSHNDSVSRAKGNGPLPVANVIGKAWFIVYPFGQLGAIPAPPDRWLDPLASAVDRASRRGRSVTWAAGDVLELGDNGGWGTLPCGLPQSASSVGLPGLIARP